MKAFKIISRVGNFVLIFCFFLPFTPVGCGGPSAQELAEKSKEDSVHMADSLRREQLHGSEKTVAVVPDSVPIAITAPDSVKNAATSIQNDTIVPYLHKASAEVPDPVWKVVLNRMIEPPNAISGFGFVWISVALLGREGSAWYVFAYLVGFIISYLSIVFLAFYALRKKAYAGRLMIGLSLGSWVYFLVFFFLSLPLHEMLYGFWTTALVWLFNLVLIWYIRWRGNTEARTNLK